MKFYKHKETGRIHSFDEWGAEVANCTGVSVREAVTPEFFKALLDDFFKYGVRDIPDWVFYDEPFHIFCRAHCEKSPDRYYEQFVSALEAVTEMN